jgi:hypothetical protein
LGKKINKKNAIKHLRIIEGIFKESGNDKGDDQRYKDNAIAVAPNLSAPRNTESD